MTGRVLDIRHWRAALERRSARKASHVRAFYAGRPATPGRSLDDILGPAFDPTGGAA